MSEMIILPAVLDSLKPARDFIASTAERHWGTDPYVPCLVANELVTHAVNVSQPHQHVIVAAYTRTGLPTIEVWDQSAKPPAIRLRDRTGRPTALGLALLPQLVNQWGTRRLVPTGSGNITWCQIRR